MRTPLAALRALVTVVALAAGAVAATVAAAPAAVAQPASVDVSPSTWAYTDSRQPLQSVVDPAGPMPVGTWRDAQSRLHNSKAYFTYDLSAFRGAQIEIGTFSFVAESAANDCAKPRATRLWIAETDTTPTWLGEPAELVDLGAPGALEGCLHNYLTWDVEAAVEHALARPDGKVTVVMRMQGVKQLLFGYGRHVLPDLRLSVKHGFPPLTPTELWVGDTPCAAGQPARPSAAPRVSAVLQDRTLQGTSADPLGATVAIWPTADPAARVEHTFDPYLPSGSRGGVHLRADDLVDGAEYTWAIRAEDRTGASEWSETCRFVYDFTWPVAPGVSSVTYPPSPAKGGGVGVAGAFTFTPNGSTDVVRYDYEWDGSRTSVAADPAGVATVSIVPTRHGYHEMTVRSYDAPGHESAPVRYAFWVREAVACTPIDAEVGTTRECVFTSPLPNTVSYTWSFGGGPATTTPAGPDGSAIVHVTPGPRSAVLEVVATTADGAVSPPSRLTVFVFNSVPVAQCVPNVATTAFDCSVTPTRTSSVASYAYRFRSDAEVVVAAAPDGSATFSVPSAGGGTLAVEALTPTGARSDTSWQVLAWGDTTPLVSNAVYPPWEVGGGFGVPSEFVLEPNAMPDVEAYEYSFDFGGTWTTVPAGADGRATFEFTPEAVDFHTLHVRSRNTEGRYSPSWAEYNFWVNWE